MIQVDPLVEFLLMQPRASVNHETLLQYATEILGDSWTAVGVLGELFYQETLRVVKLRNREALLASKMVPLIKDDASRSVGHNYHFWKIIGASLYHRSTLVGRGYGYFDNAISNYKMANNLGFDVADHALK